MKKILVAYTSTTGFTQKMAENIAEGIRLGGNEAVLKKISDFKAPGDLENYDGYVFGCPTYYRNVTAEMQHFFFLARNCELAGKRGGAFGSYNLDGEAPGIIFETMESILNMEIMQI